MLDQYSRITATQAAQDSEARNRGVSALWALVKPTVLSTNRSDKWQVGLESATNDQSYIAIGEQDPRAWRIQTYDPQQCSANLIRDTFAR